MAPLTVTLKPCEGEGEPFCNTYVPIGLPWPAVPGADLAVGHLLESLSNHLKLRPTQAIALNHQRPDGTLIGMSLPALSVALDRVSNGAPLSNYFFGADEEGREVVLLYSKLTLERASFLTPGAVRGTGLV